MGEHDAGLIELIQAQFKLDEPARTQLEGSQGYLTGLLQSDLGGGNQDRLIEAGVTAPDVPHRRGGAVPVRVDGVLADVAGKLIGQRHRLGIGIALYARQPGLAQTQPPRAGPQQIGRRRLAADGRADSLQGHEVVVVTGGPGNVVEPAPTGVGAGDHGEQIL